MSLPALHRHKNRAIVKMACTPELSLRGPEGAVAISGRHCRYTQSAAERNRYQI